MIVRACAFLSEPASAGRDDVRDVLEGEGAGPEGLAELVGREVVVVVRSVLESPESVGAAGAAAGVGPAAFLGCRSSSCEAGAVRGFRCRTSKLRLR